MATTTQKIEQSLCTFHAFPSNFQNFFVIKTACFLDQRASWQNIFFSFWQIAFFSVEKRVSHERLFFLLRFHGFPFINFLSYAAKRFSVGSMMVVCESLYLSKKYRELWRHLKGHLGRGTHHPSKPIYQKRWLLDQLLLFTILYWAERRNKCWSEVRCRFMKNSLILIETMKNIFMKCNHCDHMTLPKLWILRKMSCLYLLLKLVDSMSFRATK